MDSAGNAGTTDIVIDISASGDIDGDRVGDDTDNCLNIYNPDQVDTDNDGLGDVCDIDDTDNDGYPDTIDNCMLTANDQTDTDTDGLGNSCDNCTDKSNVDQRDTDGDGYGNLCDADLNNDNTVDFADLAKFKSVFFTSDADADLNGDLRVDFADLAILKQMFFGPPGPSGLVP